METLESGVVRNKLKKRKHRHTIAGASLLIQHHYTTGIGSK